MDNMDDDYEYVERLNKSQQKRDILVLTAATKYLAELDKATLLVMKLPDDLYAALVAVQGMKNQARKRQFKFIVKLLRQNDPDVWVQMLAEVERKKTSNTQYFHRLERWRDSLLAEGQAGITAFMDAYPQADAGQLRQLIRKANKEAVLKKPPKSSRALFQLLKEIVVF
ncbi:MAG: ribosome biogenesis factor YjgA [Mariprofundaceae bacterium]|nr:ribosome biogenesis factor YjgA [Mariprofundaceae bacterium]